jgi:NADPH:quinone reductase
VCRKLGALAALGLEVRQRSALGPGQVRVSLRACAVNFPDLLMVEGKYQHKPSLPFTPGLEGAGTITEVAPAIDHVRVGDNVIVWQCIGTFADEIVLAAEHVVQKPARLTFEEAAGFLVAHSTAYHALLTRARLVPGEVVLVLGAAGGVGLAAVQLASCLGARVIAAASTSNKLAVAAANGADHLINYEEEDLALAVKRITGDRGADVILDPVGGGSATPTLRCLAFGGRLLIVGFAAGKIPLIEANRVLLRGGSVLGVRAGEAARREPGLRARELAALLGLADQHGLRPVISRRFPLDRFLDGLQLLATRAAIGRVVLLMPGT